MGYGVVLLTHMLYIFIQLNATSTIPGYPTLAMKPGVYIQNVGLPYVALVPLNTITESHSDKLRLRSTERTNFSKTDFCWRAIQTVRSLGENLLDYNLSHDLGCRVNMSFWK